MGSEMCIRDRSYRFARTFTAFEALKAGEVLGINAQQETLKCPFDCVTLFGKSKNRKLKSYTNEVFFLMEYKGKVGVEI